MLTIRIVSIVILSNSLIRFRNICIPIWVGFANPRLQLYSYELIITRLGRDMCMIEHVMRECRVLVGRLDSVTAVSPTQSQVLSHAGGHKHTTPSNYMKENPTQSTS